MNNLSKTILQKIEEKNIKPKSRFYFRFKNIIAWTLTIISLVFSSFLTSALAFIFSNRILIPMHILDWFILIDVVLLGIATYFAYRHFQLIKNSYRTRLKYVLLGVLVFIFTLSFIFVQFRLYGNIDSFAQKKFPRLSIQNYIYHEWSRPEKTGVLAGEIIKVDENGYISIRDFREETHLVDPVLLNTKQKDIFLKNLRVRMFGFEDNNIFYPDRVESWEFRHGPKYFHPEYKRLFQKDNLVFPSR